MDKERLDFHTALVNKIKEWEGTADFSAGSTNRQKLNRSLNLLLGTNPDVLVDFFDINTVPDDPREAMNLIRGADLKTLKDLEIFALKGLGQKLVGHHQIAANTLGVHLNNMSPSDRLDVYKGMLDLGQKHGMDPRQIMTIPDAIHRTIAHGGDFKGIKTGAMLPLVIGERGVDFLKRFESSINVQLGMGQAALADPSTQNWKAAFRGAAESIGFPNSDVLFDFETPLEVKGQATRLFAPVAQQVSDIVNKPGQIIQDIPGQVVEAIGQAGLDPKKVRQVQQSIIDFTGGAVKTIPKPVRQVMGVTAGLGALDVLGNVAQAAEGISTIQKATSKPETTAGVLDVVGAGLGTAAMFNPLTAIPAMVMGATAGGMKMRIARDVERERTQQVMAGEVSRYGPTVTQTPTITKPESDYELRRRARTGR
jgi:hypothetical protein